VTVRRRSPRWGTWPEPRGYTEPGTVYLVGTSHVSAASADDVGRVIAAVRPDAVVVELCRSRAGLLEAPPPPPPPAGSGANGGGGVGGVGGGGVGGGARVRGGALALGGDGGMAATLGRSLRLGGNAALALRLALAAVLARRDGGMPAGADGGGGDGAAGLAPVGVDFRAARVAAAAVGAEVVLGDRPVEITLRRAWAALGWVDRLRLGWLLGRGGLAGAAAADGADSATAAAAAATAAAAAGGAPPPTGAPPRPPAQGVGLDIAAAVDAAASARPSDDALDAYMGVLAGAFPALVAPLVTERDLYLAWSVKRSQAVKGADRVVGVVGRAHVRGVLRACDEDDAARGGGRPLLTFRDLVG